MLALLIYGQAVNIVAKRLSIQVIVFDSIGTAGVPVVATVLFESMKTQYYHALTSLPDVLEGVQEEPI